MHKSRAESHEKEKLKGWELAGTLEEMKHRLADLRKHVGQTTEKQLQQEKGLASEKVKQKDMWNRLLPEPEKALEKVTEELQQTRERQAALESRAEGGWGGNSRDLTEVLPYPGTRRKHRISI